MAKITPCLWFDGNAEDAARFYVSLLPDSRIDEVVSNAADNPGGKTGSVLLVHFTLAGQDYTALNGGPNFRFNEAVSFIISCTGQAEVDRLWAALTAEGGAPVQCGWLKDKYGLSWQIVPDALPRLLKQGNPDQKARVMRALMQMVKLDIAGLEQAYAG